MPILATWIREVDDAPFARWFAARPELEILNARLSEHAVVEAGDPLPPGTAGLLLSGGPDIAAEFLRQPIPDPSIIEEPDSARDHWEFAAVRAALARELPIFAICKGVQVLNVALGGTLHLDIPSHDAPEQRDGNIQALRYADQAPATPRFAAVNSSHHQALDQLGEGVTVEAWAGDGTIEQVRLQAYPFCLGVQYHPERHEQYAPLFQEFFDRVAAHSLQTVP